MPFVPDPIQTPSNVPSGFIPDQPSSGFIPDAGSSLSFPEKDKGFLERTSVGGFGESIGTALAVPGARKLQEQTTEQSASMQNAILRQLQDPNVPRERKEVILRMVQNQSDDILGSVKEFQKSTKQVLGEAAGTLATAAIGAAAPGTVVGRVGMGIGVGALAGGGKAAREEASGKDILKSTAVGGAIGGAISGAFEGVGGLLKMARGTQFVKDKTTNVYNKELQPPTKELETQIKRGFETFGGKVRDVVDDSGKPVYVGTYKQLLQKSKDEVKNQGNILQSKLKDYNNISATRDEISGDIVQRLSDEYGTLTDLQVQTVKDLVRKMPQKMNPTQMLENKRLYDRLVSNTDWSKIAQNTDPQLSFATEVKYILRDNLRKAINEKTKDASIQAINNRMGIGMEVRDLAATQIARRAKEKITSSNVFTRVIGKIIDDVLFNPAMTTKTSQIIDKGITKASPVLAQTLQSGITGGIVGIQN